MTDFSSIKNVASSCASPVGNNIISHADLVNKNETHTCLESKHEKLRYFIYDINIRKLLQFIEQLSV